MRKYISTAPSMFSRLFRNESIRELAPQLVLLSVVTSLALNATAIRRQREERNLTFHTQVELLTRVRDQLRYDRRRTLMRSPEICKKMVLAGLKPSDFGFESSVASDAESSIVPYSRHLSWYEAFFSSKNRPDKAGVPEAPKVESTNEDDWDGAYPYQSNLFRVFEYASRTRQSSSRKQPQSLTNIIIQTKILQGFVPPEGYTADLSYIICISAIHTPCSVIS